jgi:hypothetical protein
MNKCHTKSHIFLKKNAKPATVLLAGEKSGKRIGNRSSIAVKDAEETKLKY